ncbi:MAG TPA: hypothetical protein VF054_18030 [Micromonosporaceae bacterium]
MSVQETSFRGFANPVDPTPDEMRAWAYRPDSVDLGSLPQDWDLLVVTERLIPTLFDLAMDTTCPARRFALHCLYIYAADAIRTNFRAHPKRRLRKMVEQAEEDGDALLAIWAHNVRALSARPELFEYHDWCEGGLVRQPRRIA